MPASTDLDERVFLDHASEWARRCMGTCVMGSGDTAAVDPELRVRGVEALRVWTPG